MPRVLLLKFGAIGDVIMAIPAAHQLHLQGHEIDWVCGQAVLPILQLYPWINPIPIDDRAFLKGSAFRQAAKSFSTLWKRLAGAPLHSRRDPILRQPLPLPHGADPRRAQDPALAHRPQLPPHARSSPHRRVRPHPAQLAGPGAPAAARARAAPSPAAEPAPAHRPKSASSSPPRARRT